jgi:hypothetical protein
MSCLSSRKNWQIGLGVTVLLISGMTALRAQTPGRDNRPASVPQDYFATPMGYFHPSCVHGLAEGDVIRKDELAVEHKDGSFDAIPACAYPHYTHSGEKVPMDGESAKPPEIQHDYIEDAIMLKDPKSTYYGELKATWTVPPDPATHSNQIIYLFPGLEDYASNPPIPTTILQPVLGWNVVSAELHLNYPNEWTLSSWNCCAKGAVWHSPFITTEAGHTIFGVMVCTHPGAPRCSSFNVNTFDQTSGKQTELSQTSSFGLVFNWAFAGALEVYNISECSDYPAGLHGSTQFYFLGLYDNELQPLDQAWDEDKLWIRQDDTPICNYGISQGLKDGLHSVTLTY